MTTPRVGLAQQMSRELERMAGSEPVTPERLRQRAQRLRQGTREGQPPTRTRLDRAAIFEQIATAMEEGTTCP